MTLPSTRLTPPAAAALTALLAAVVPSCDAAHLESADMVGNSRPVLAGEAPWQVSIQYTPLGFNNCGGALLDRRWILSAAHCIYAEGMCAFAGEDDDCQQWTPWDMSPLIAVAGILELSASDQGQIRAIDRAFAHPRFNSGILNPYRDLALMRLAEPVDFVDGVVAPIAPADGALEEAGGLSPGTRASATGWGRTDPEVQANSDALMLAEVELMDYTEARNIYSPEGYHVTRDMLPARDIGLGSPCKGDSGGPLVVNDESGAPRVAGVTSWGDGCSADTPSMFAKVSYFEPWIREQLSPGSWIRLVPDAHPFLYTRPGDSQSLRVDDLGELDDSDRDSPMRLRVAAHWPLASGEGTLALVGGTEDGELAYAVVGQEWEWDEDSPADGCETSSRRVLRRTGIGGELRTIELSSRLWSSVDFDAAPARPINSYVRELTVAGTIALDDGRQVAIVSASDGGHIDVVDLSAGWSDPGCDVAP